MPRHRPLRWFSSPAGFLILFAGLCPPAAADDAPPPPVRQLLYPARIDDVPATLRPAVDRLLAADQKPAEPPGVKPAGVFVRVVTRKHVLDGGGLKKDGTLGTKPFVFVTLPEAIHGRGLLSLFSAIGYSADAVLTGQLNEEKVAVVFRWEDGVVIHAGTDGRLPDTWQSAVYPTNWDNLFALVDRMACDVGWHDVAAGGVPLVPTRLRLLSLKERQFVLGFPDEGKERLRKTSYHALRATGGADWEYRGFLERSMSLAEYFSGDGTCKPTIVGPGKVPAGFPEFVGPNRPVAALPAVAVIGLGALRVGER